MLIIVIEDDRSNTNNIRFIIGNMFNIIISYLYSFLLFDMTLSYVFNLTAKFIFMAGLPQYGKKSVFPVRICYFQYIYAKTLKKQEFSKKKKVFFLGMGKCGNPVW